jgi:monoamine oxidase
MREVDVVVIGAGAAGMAAARRLQAAPLSVLVLEARPRAGGRAWTDVVDGLPLDLGCGWLHSADGNEWAALAPKLGLTIDKTPPPWTRRSGDLAWPHESAEDFRAAVERFYERLEAAADGPDRPASELLEPGSRWSGLIDAMSTWINGVETDQVSIRDWGRYRDSGVNWRVLEGYGALVAQAGAALDVRLATPVTLIDHSGPRLRIETAQGALAARAAIITAPTNVIAEETLRFSPPLPDKLRAAHALPLGLDDKLFLRLARPDDFPIEKRVFGATDTARTGSYHLRPFGRPIIEVYFGGELARDLEREGDAAFAAFAADQLASHFGAGIRRQLTPFAVSAWARDPYARGAYSYARVGGSDARGVLAAPVGERLFFAGEACSAHDFSTAHGAYRTGVAAAEQTLRALVHSRRKQAATP